LEFALRAPWRTAQFPANREKGRELLEFWPIGEEMAPKSPMILGGSGKITYASEQGICFAEQGIKVPCSAVNRDIVRLIRRLFEAFHARAPKRSEESKSEK